MELMDDSLTHFLEQSEVRLPYHVQVNINYDIAQALTFLHANQILHRDLSSNNVLLIGDGARAKVTYFGMSKLTTLHSRMTPLTACPGTPAYMSPEAMLDPPVYTEKLDCFQAGVLMVQTITRKFPDPGPSMNRVRDDRSRTGWVNVPVPETEHRENHLRLVTATHPIYPLIVDCLKDTDTQRPSAQQICHQLSGLRDTPQYQQSHEAGGRGGGGEMETEIQERDQLIQQLQEGNEARKRERERGEREREREREERVQLIQRLREENEARERERERGEREREREREERDQCIQQLQEENETREREREREREKEKERESRRGRERENRSLCQSLEKQQNIIRELRELVNSKISLIREKERQVHEKDAPIHRLQQSQQLSYTSKVSGPGLHSATVNHSTHVIVKLMDSSDRLASLPQNITAQLETETTPTRATRWSWSKKPEKRVSVAMTTPSRYEVSYIAVS